MASIKPRVKVPKKAGAGEVVTIKSLISHPMVTGLQKDKDGNPIPRQIIHTFVASFNGQEVIRINVEPAVSANPYFEFEMKVPETGTLHFEWHDDDGTVYSEDKKITVG